MTKLEKNMAALITLTIAFGTITIVGMFSTHITISRNYKSYRETYKALLDGEYVKENQFGDQTYFKKAVGSSHKEIIKFANGSIKLLNNDYLHADSFITWFSPYSLYYQYKFNKLFKQLEMREETPIEDSLAYIRERYNFHMRTAQEQERALREGYEIHSYIDNSIDADISIKPFKFLSKNN